MRNEDAYKVLLGQYSLAKAEGALSPSYEVVYILGVAYHLYDSWYATLEGDPGDRYTCVIVPSGYQDASSYKVMADGTGEEGSLGVPSSGMKEMTGPAAGQSRTVFVLDDCEVDVFFAGNSVIPPVNYRTLVRPTGQTAQTVVTYDHPLDHYRGAWGEPGQGGDGPGVEITRPCPNMAYYSCSNEHFTLDDDVDFRYTGLLTKNRYIYYCASVRKVPESVVVDQIPYYRREYAYSGQIGDVYVAPVEVGATQLGVVTRERCVSCLIGVSYGTPASLLVDGHLGGDVSSMMSGTCIVEDSGLMALAIAGRGCGGGSGDDGDGCNIPAPGLTEHCWAVEKRACEGLFLNGVTVQERYVLVERDWPYGAYRLGEATYWTMQVGECVLVGNDVLKEGPLALAGTPWVCEANAQAAPGSTSWTPACPSETQACKKVFVIYLENEYCATENCGGPLLKEKTVYKSMEITDVFYSGEWSESAFEIEKSPYTIGVSVQRCVDCNGEQTDERTVYSVVPNGVYRRLVKAYRKYPAVDGNGYTAQQLLEEDMDAFTSLNDTSCPDGAGCDGCLRYVTAMGAEPVYISLGTVVAGQFFVPNTVTVDSLYAGWDWTLVERYDNGGTLMDHDVLVLPVKENFAVKGSGALYGECRHIEFVQENGTIYVMDADLPFGYDHNGSYDTPYSAYVKLIPPC